MDRTSTAQALGKEVNQDVANDKKSIVDILGIDKAKEYIKVLEEDTIAKIGVYGKKSQNLIDLCKFLSNRNN